MIFQKTKIATKLLMTFSLFILMNSAFAETEKTINYQNQREESFSLENFLKETRFKQEEVQSTCVRQVPYTQNICRNETRYREQCRTVLGHQECRVVYDRICHNETRYEQECNTYPGEELCRVVIRYREECSRGGGGRRECRQIPPDVRCHRAPNGEQRCEKIPGRMECTEAPGQRICRQVPYEERQCVRGPARQVCRQVPRTQQICENRPRQQCDWIPDQRICENIPYQEQVCKDEVLYRQEEYACMKTINVPYEVTLKTHKAEVQLDFLTSAASVTPVLNISLNTNGALALTAKDQGANQAVVFVKKDVRNASAGEINTISAKYQVALFDRAETFSFIDKGLSQLDLNKTALTFYVNGKFEQKRVSLGVRIAKGNDVKFEKSLTAVHFKSEFDGVGTRVSIDLQKLGAPKLGGIFSKKHQVTLRFKLDYKDQGEILLPLGGELSVMLNQETNVD